MRIYSFYCCQDQLGKNGLKYPNYLMVGLKMQLKIDIMLYSEKKLSVKITHK